MVTTSGTDAVDEPRRRFGQILREARKSIPVDTVFLGNIPRPPNRLGKPVSHEELAEAVGISRVWYARLEGGHPIRASPSLLQRIGEALMLDEHQRCALLRFGVPELSSTLLESRNAPVLKAYGLARATLKRFWSASTIDETLRIAAEEAGSYFANADLVFFVRRVADGSWNHPFVVDRGLGARQDEMFAELASSLPSAAFDEIALYPLLSGPGDVGSRDTFKATSVGAAYEEGLAKYKLGRSTFLHARICSRGGITGGITVKHARECDYSDADRAFISGIAAMASLALS